METTRNKKKKYNEIVMLAKSKLNSIKTLISKATIDKSQKIDAKKDELNEEKSRKYWNQWNYKRK